MTGGKGGKGGNLPRGGNQRISRDVQNWRNLAETGGNPGRRPVLLSQLRGALPENDRRKYRKYRKYRKFSLECTRLEASSAGRI
jgi:hypothetical protein